MRDNLLDYHAEKAAQDALSQAIDCINSRQHFLLEAGAGAGKTYNLVKIIKYLIKSKEKIFLRKHQAIACISYTNAAVDEIQERTHNHAVINSATIHAFCWEIINQFQTNLWQEIINLENWKTKLSESKIDQRIPIVYEKGHPYIDEGGKFISLGHNDVITLTTKLLGNTKFKKILASRYPYILIDEYQDMNSDFAQKLIEELFDENTGPIIGLFGDSWQKIYRDGCGLLTHERLKVIQQNSNFRSGKVIVDSLNRIRTELKQYPRSDAAEGSIKIYHTNLWNGERRKENHWKGDLPPNVAHQCLEWVKQDLGWDFNKSKILMLTHNVLATEQDYPNIPRIFRYNDAFIKKENPIIEFLVDVIEPVCEAYENKQYGKMFSIPGIRAYKINNIADKQNWALDLQQLCDLRKTNVENVINFAINSERFIIPDNVKITIEDINYYLNSEDDTPRHISESTNLLKIQYKEIVLLKKFIDDKTPFSTKHGVKGLEFENVLIIFGGGWNNYNWNQYLEYCSGTLPDKKKVFFERNRNLFYVCCSRPKANLSLLFTQELSNTALTQLKEWFSKPNFHAINFDNF